VIEVSETLSRDQRFWLGVAGGYSCAPGHCLQQERYYGIRSSIKPYSAPIPIDDLCSFRLRLNDA
jgi:hypothetical protein